MGHVWSNRECQGLGRKGPELSTMAYKDMPFLGSGSLCQIGKGLHRANALSYSKSETTFGMAKRS